MKKIIKQMCWMIAFLLMLFTIFFHHAILTLLATGSLQVYSIAKWGQSLHYEHAFLENYQLVIIKPRLNHESLFKADRLALNFDINFWKRQLHLQIEMEQPHWHIENTAPSSWEKWSTLFNQKDRWLKVDPHFYFKEGTLTWLDKDSLQTLKFDAKINNQEGGYLKLYFNPDDLDSRFLVLQTLKASQGKASYGIASHGVEVSCLCEQVDCSSAIALAQFLGIDFSQWMISSGSLQGKLKAIFSAMHRPYLEGELFVDDLVFNKLGSPLRGHIEEARLQLEKNEVIDELNQPFFPIIGKLEILKPASLSYDAPSQEWHIHHILGSIQLDNVGTALIDIQAEGQQFPLETQSIDIQLMAALQRADPLDRDEDQKRYEEDVSVMESESGGQQELLTEGRNFLHPSLWSLQGKANLNAQRSLGLELLLTCSVSKQSVPQQSDGKIHFSLNQVQQGSKHLEVDCEKLSYNECHFLQTLLATQWPVFNAVKLKGGEFNAIIETDFTHQGIGELYIKQFEAFHLSAILKPWNIACDFGKVRGHGKMHLGKVNFWPVVPAKKGLPPDSGVSSSPPFLAGVADFWQSLHAGLHLEDGKIEFEDLSPPLPITDIQAHLSIQQGEVDHSLVTLQVAGLKGKMDVEWGKNKQLLTFKLDGVAQDLSDLFPNGLREGIRNHFYHNRLMVLANLKRQNQQFELGGTLHIQRGDATEQMDLIHFGCDFKKVDFPEETKHVPTGWFHAQKLPLEKYLSPFIFRNGILSMSGEAEFKGSFDDQCLFIKYDADDLKIENEDLCIEIPRLHATHPGQLVGSHQLDLHTHVYQGTLPIQSGSYFEKNTGLIFKDIQGNILFKNGLILINPIEACCEGVHFGGHLELDYRDPAPGVFDVSIRCPSVTGKVSEIQCLLAHVEQPSLLYKIPLEGEVLGKGDGLQLKFAFVPQDYQLTANIKGCLNEGALFFQGVDMALKGIDMDVDYDHQRQLLKFSDIQGALLVGKPRRVEEYLLTGHHIHFHQITEPNIDIDLAIKDKQHELVRLVGYTQDEENGIKNLYLDSKISHFSHIYPTKWECQLKGWSNIEQLDFHSTFHLQEPLQDLKRFRQTGLFFLSPSMIDQISQFLPLEGEGSLALSYQPDQSYTFHLEGSHIKQGNSAEHFGVIKGSKQDKKWTIDHVQWDDWSAYAELHEMDEKWRIPFLGLKVGQTLLLGLEGDWLHDDTRLKAKLKFCQVDLSKLENFSSLQPFVTKWWPKGILSATGEIEWDLLVPNALEGCRANLFAEVNNFTIRNCSFKILNSFQLKIKPHDYVCFKDLQVGLNDQAFIDLKECEYRLSQESIHSLEASFQIPHQQLECVAETLHHHFPEALDASIKEILSSLKQGDPLKGLLTVEKSSSNQSLFRLRLDDGRYIFKGREFDLKKFQLQVTEDELNFTAFTQEERLPFQMIGKIKLPSCEEGSCQFFSSDGTQPLCIKWDHQAEEKWAIRSMQGEFGGCFFDLKSDHNASQNNEWSALQGKVSIDFNRMSSLLTLDSAESIRKLKIGSLFTLNGHFWINPAGGSTFFDTVSFKGKLTSREAILKGYQIQNFQADLQYVPGRLDIQNVLIEDPAGNAKMSNSVVLLDQTQGLWSFFIPRLTVKNFRPTLLRDTENYAQSATKFRSLILKKIDFQNLSGNIKDVPSWEGLGNLQFVNSSPKNALQALFAIPAEIILRLGLDPNVLSPVTGMIYFNLHGDRFYLNRFKDVYSEGRGSKFYLAGPDPSWVDFDGNLSVNIRMKQYNLMFKIAELFTFSIRGNIKKPNYTLQKQSKTLQKQSKGSRI